MGDCNKCKYCFEETINNIPLVKDIKDKSEVLGKLAEARDLIKRLLATPRSIYRRDEDGENTSFFNPDYEELKKQVEQFLKEQEIQEDRLCEHCDQYKSYPNGRCRICDNGSKWKRG